MIRKEQVYATEFEETILSEVERQVNSLPTAVVDCYIGPSQGNLGIVAPTFEVRPTNARGARISGAVLQGEGLVINVGHSRREFKFKGSSSAEAADCASQLSRICRAVFAGNFTESLRVDRSGKPISSFLKLHLNGSEVRMWRNRLITDLFKSTRKREIRYAPYTKDSERASQGE
jgi:hypothetical protein